MLTLCALLQRALQLMQLITCPALILGDCYTKIAINTDTGLVTVTTVTVNLTPLQSEAHECAFRHQGKSSSSVCLHGQEVIINLKLHLQLWQCRLDWNMVKSMSDLFFLKFGTFCSSGPCFLLFTGILHIPNCKYSETFN